MIGYTITSGTPTPQEVAALERALMLREQPKITVKAIKSKWSTPQLRTPLARNS